MAIKIVFFTFLAFLTFAAQKSGAGSFATAQIRARATVIIPLGLVDKRDSGNNVYPDHDPLTAIEICRPQNAGIAIEIRANGNIKKYSFSKDKNGRTQIERMDRINLSLDQTNISLNEITTPDTCLITLIYSEN
jgi:hypothetical protein